MKRTKLQVTISRVIEKTIFFSVCCILISFPLAFIIPSTSAFAFNELKSFLDYKGEKRAKLKFSKRLAELNLNPNNLDLCILVRKSKKRLILSSKNVVIASFPVGLGKSPVGIKLNGKDNKTPEGEYKICKKIEHAVFHLFMQINYPASDDAKRGAVQQLLKPGEEEAIEKAWAENRIPPTDTAMGGPIGIQGFGAESNWTHGSIAMHNIDIEELFWNVPLGTPVIIVP